MTDFDLDAIAQRAEAATDMRQRETARNIASHVAHYDVPALVARVRELEAKWEACIVLLADARSYSADYEDERDEARADAARYREALEEIVEKAVAVLEAEGAASIEIVRARTSLLPAFVRARSALSPSPKEGK